MGDSGSAASPALHGESAPITFYYASGSPFSWKVWLALEHKQVPYVPWQMSLDAGDLRAPEYASVNPRRQVPAIVDDGFALYESAAVVEYLEDRYPDSGEPLWPSDARARALSRRVAAEADGYVYPPINSLMLEYLGRGGADPEARTVAAARERLAAELELMTRAVAGPFVAGHEPSAADFALYPMLALLARIEARVPDSALMALVPDRLRTWMNIVAALPYYDRTYPPHWRT